MSKHVPVVPDPRDEPTVPLWPTTARAFGIGRTAAYEQAAAGTLPVPVLRIGGKFRVPTAALRRVLGLDSDEDSKVAS